MLGAIKDSIGSFLGTNRSRPTISVEQLGYSQEDYDALKDRREDYDTDFEGEGGFADQARSLRAQQQGFLNRLTGDGGLYDRAMDTDYLTQDQGFYAGLLEQQRAAQDRANQEMLRRQVASSGMSPEQTSGFLSRFKSMTDPFGERASAEALQAANMSMQNRGSMLDRGASLLGQGGNFLSGQSNLLGQEAGFSSFGYQDALNQMKAMDDARLAAVNMDFQGQMADYNSPTDFDRAMGLASGVGSLAGGIGMLGKGAGPGGLKSLFS